jgi:arginyl-tRNA synthetase
MTTSATSLASLPHVEGTDPSRCVLDLFRVAIAKRLADAFPGKLSIDAAYVGVDYGKKGVDFTVALPRFRLGGKVDELANAVTSKVRQRVGILSETK